MFSKDWPKQKVGSADLLDSMFSKILKEGGLPSDRGNCAESKQTWHGMQTLVKRGREFAHNQGPQMCLQTSLGWAK